MIEVGRLSVSKSLIPWIDPNNCFGPGLNVNILIALISLVLLLTNLRPLIRTRAGHRP